MDIEKFIYAGNSTFTVRSKVTGKHFTFKANKKEDVFFFSLLNGPNNESDFSYLCFGRRGQNPRLSAKSCANQDSPSFKALSWFLKNINSDKVEFHHEGKCGRCGRKLTTPQSLESGFGPECSEKV